MLANGVGSTTYGPATSASCAMTQPATRWTTSPTANELTNLRVFGSVARGEDRPDSDVDLLVDPPLPHMGLLGLGRV